MNRAAHWAVGCQLLSAAYLQVVEWVPLAPWNNLTHGNGQAGLDLALLVAQLLTALAYARGRLVSMVLGWLGYAVWLYLQWQSWWQPYLFGGRTVGPNWYFAHTWKVLPVWGDRPTPDANHMVLQLTLVAVLITSAWAIRAVARSNSAFRQANPGLAQSG